MATWRQLTPYVGENYTTEQGIGLGLRLEPIMCGGDRLKRRPIGQDGL